MAVKMGEDNIIKVYSNYPNNNPASGQNELSIDYKKLGAGKYDVTITLNCLSKIWYNRAKNGQMYLCLARKKWDHRYTVHRRYKYFEEGGWLRSDYSKDGHVGFVPYTEHSCFFGEYNVIKPYVYRVTPEKSKYTFHVDFTYYVDAMYDLHRDQYKVYNTDRVLVQAIEVYKEDESSTAYKPYIDLAGFYFYTKSTPNVCEFDTNAGEFCPSCFFLCDTCKDNHNKFVDKNVISSNPRFTDVIRLELL